jgi:hypothetical protein
MTRLVSIFSPLLFVASVTLLASTAAASEFIHEDKLETLKDMCSNRILSLGPNKTFKLFDRKDSPIIPIEEVAISNNSLTFRWFCGSTAERSTCPPLTTHVKVSRNHEGRRFTTDCLRRQSCKPGQKTLDVLYDNCSNRNLRVGNTSVSDRQTSSLIPIEEAALNSTGGFRWYCGRTAERSNCPDGTTHLKIDRNHEGRRFTSDCIRKQPICKSVHGRTYKDQIAINKFLGKKPTKIRAEIKSRVCLDEVRKIPWDKSGKKTWYRNNISRLCQGVEGSTEPAKCFNKVMYSGINWGGGTRWNPMNALDLCEKTNYADGTINCFTHQVSNGKHWKQAIEFCGKK